MSARFLRGRFAWVCVLTALCVITLAGCIATRQPPQGDIVEGRSARPAWRKPGPARLQARHEAVLDARNKIWNSLLTERVDTKRLDWTTAQGPDSVSLEYLTLTDPVFESRLRAYIGSLEPFEILDKPNGELVARLNVKRSDVLSLVCVAIAAMRAEGRSTGDNDDEKH